MTKRSKHETARRTAESERMREIEAAWMGSLNPETAASFRRAVEEARNRPPAERAPDMAPGTAPRPPRPGHEPRPSKEERKRRPRD